MTTDNQADPDWTYDPDAILADPNSHPIHKAYAEINIGIRDRGEKWSKCANCGSPYRMDIEGFQGNETVCSKLCFAQFAASLSERWYDHTRQDIR